ncbi:MAG: extracellular solute-binding protein [Chloroflexota bacterium]|nr:extracellular solute-binding protein [Chloroflexota bacterium]MDE3193100.1 extracellular solute-binding protein [Chloroflexota bacterium]
MARPIAIFLSVLGLVASACGGAAQPSAAPSAAATTAGASAAATAAAKPGEVDAATLAKAKQEGKVVFYTSLQTDDADPLVKAFMKAYPEIKVDLNRKSSSKILTQFMTEAKAGKVLADVLETGGLDLAEPYDKGLTLAFDPPAAKDIPKEYHQLNGSFVGARLALSTFGWNTSQVKAGQEPKTWEDILDPAWKGKILIEASDWDVMQGLAKNKWGGDQAKTTDYFTKLAANKPQLIDGHTEMLAALVAGQGAIGWGLRGDTMQEQIESKKIPGGWSKGEIMLRLQGAVISKDAPHPNAAKVFVNWYVSKDGGQKTLAGIGRFPAVPGMAPAAYSGFGKTFVSGPDDAKDLPKYEKLWNELIAKK